MTEDELEIRQVIERWAVWRDGGDWDRLATLWHPGGRMRATWFEGPAEDFVAKSREGWSKGVNVTHFLGGIAVDIEGPRAAAQTKMSITQRVTFQDQLVDVICTGRFFDLMSKKGGAWKIDRRLLFYENDRVVPVVPGPPLRFDAAELAALPEGYRHLGTIQKAAGMSVTPDLPGRTGAAHDTLLATGRRWLAGEEID